jgi:hypothetical protein
VSFLVIVQRIPYSGRAWPSRARRAQSSPGSGKRRGTVGGGALFAKRVSLIVGHFGSGKTEIAVNAALSLAEAGTAVALVDLDVVKPYFRSRSARSLLAEAGVELVAPTGDHFYADLPIIVPRVRSLLREQRVRVILDVGGDDTGARVVGSIADLVRPEETDCLLVLNFRRPFTPDPEHAVEMARQIEAVSRVSLTGVISNTHLMGETSADVVVRGYELALEAGRRLGLPVVGVTVAAELADGRGLERLDCPLLRLRRLVRPPHELTPQVRATGPLFVLS